MATIAPAEITTISLPTELCAEVRDFIATSEETKDISMEQFVEQAVRNYLLMKVTNRVRAAFSDLNDGEIDTLVNEALEEVRAHR